MTTYTAREAWSVTGIPGTGIEIQVFDDEQDRLVATFRDLILWNVFLNHAGTHKHTVTYVPKPERGAPRIIRGTEAETTRETA